MFKHDKALLRELKVERPNPQYAVLMQEQLGGANGELKAAMQYLSQSFRVKDPQIKDLFLDIAAEELSHMEMVAQTINLLNGHEVDYNKVGQGEIETHVLSGLAPFLINSSGEPWTAHNVLFRDALNKVQNTGSNRDFGVTKDSKLYFDLSTPGPNHDTVLNNVNPPSFEQPLKK